MSKPKRLLPHFPSLFLSLAPALLPHALLCIIGATCSPALAQEVPNCLPPKIPLNPHMHKSEYRIAVHAIRGLENAMEYYNNTFQDYLSATAGQQFDPPIRFQLVPFEFNDMMLAVEAQTVDFVYSNPGSYS